MSIMSRQRSPVAVLPPSGIAAGTGVSPNDVPSASLDGSAKVPFEQAATSVLGHLQHALSDVLAALPADLRRATDVERALGIDYTLSWQLHKIVKSDTPLAVGMNVPARTSMKKFFAAAAEKGIPDRLITAASEAFDVFEDLVASEAKGDRETFGSMLSIFLPEMRQKRELAAKQSVYKGMSEIKGLSTETWISIALLHPSSDPSMLDAVMIMGQLGLCRVHRDAPVVIELYNETSGAGSPRTTLDGDPLDGPFGSLLPKFSSLVPELKTEVTENSIRYVLRGTDIGMQSAIDIVLAHRQQRAVPRYWNGRDPRLRGTMFFTETPVKRLIKDFFVHKDALPTAPPQMIQTDLVGLKGGRMACLYASPQDNPVFLHESMREIVGGVPNARVPQLPRYVELLDVVCKKLGWDPMAFRGFRLDVQYPVYGVSYGIGYELPEMPTGGVSGSGD